MNFKEAYKEMLKGKKVRRPGWGGYWFIEDNKIKIRLKDGNIKFNAFTQETITNTLAEDWKVVKESKAWEPKEREPYYYVDSNGEVLGDCNSNHRVDKDRICLGNCFKTKEEADHMVEKLKVINELKNFALENNEEEIDWNNLSQRKYVIIYDPEDQNVDVYCYWRTQYLPFNIYFTSEKIAQKAIEMDPNQISCMNLLERKKLKGIILI